MKRIQAILVILITATWSSGAGAIGIISDNTVSFEYTTDFGTSSGNTVNTDFTGTGAGDQLYESWWFFRVEGDASETAFGAPDTETYAGSYADLRWTDTEARGLFDAQLELAVIDSGSSSGNLFQELTITNTSGGPLDLHLFHYSDFDVSGSSGNDSAVLDAVGTDIQMTITDGATADFVPFIGYGADAYHVTTWRGLLNALTNGAPTNLGDAGLPLNNADFTAAFQWDRILNPGESESFLIQFGADAPLLPPTAMPAPEPGTGVLICLGLAGLAYEARRVRVKRELA